MFYFITKVYIEMHVMWHEIMQNLVKSLQTHKQWRVLSFPSAYITQNTWICKSLMYELCRHAIWHKPVLRQFILHYYLSRNSHCHLAKQFCWIMSHIKLQPYCTKQLHIWKLNALLHPLLFVFVKQKTFWWNVRTFCERTIQPLNITCKWWRRILFYSTSISYNAYTISMSNNSESTQI